eukprot:RCo040211
MKRSEMEDPTLDKLLSRSVLHQPSLSSSAFTPKPAKLSRSQRKLAKSAKLQEWYGIGQPRMTTVLRQDLVLIQNRELLNETNKRYAYKKPSKQEIGKYFEVGHVVPSALDYYTLPKKRLGEHLVDEWTKADRAKALVENFAKKQTSKKWRPAARTQRFRFVGLKKRQRRERVRMNLK